MYKTQPFTKASALIITLGVLMLISITGILFTNVSQVERKASVNFTNALYARLTAIAGIERTSKTLIQTSFLNSYDTLNSVIFPKDPITKETVAGLDPTDNPGFPISISGNIGYWSYPDTGAPVPCSGYVGKNDASNKPSIGNYGLYGNIFTLKVLDCASQININMQDPSLPMILTNLGERIQHWGAIGAGNHYIISKIPSIKDGADSAVNPLPVGLVNNIIAHGVFKSKDDLLNIIGQRNYEIIKDFVTISSWMDYNQVGSAAPSQLPENLPVYTKRARAPVNINTASKPVLEALIMGLNANVPLFNVDPSEHVSDDTGLGFVEDKYIYYKVEFANVGGFNATVAENIATKIIKYRWDNPFTTWEDFYNFVDNPNNDTSKIRIGDLPNNTNKPLWISNEKWYQLCRDVLKANFNPNVRETRFGFAGTGNCLVSKGDLTASSTEFCFSSMGRFEITSYSQITSNNVIVATDEIRACIQAYDFRRHTTQKDFEGDASLRANFTNTITYPENMDDIKTAGGNIDLSVNNYCGWVEPKTVDGSGINTASSNIPPGYMNNLIFKHDFKASSSPAKKGLDADVGGGKEANPATLEEINRTSASFVNIRSGYRMKDASDGGTSPLRLISPLMPHTPATDLMADGVFSHYLRNRYLAFRASPEPPNGVTTGGLIRGVNCDTSTASPNDLRFNLPYYRGALEFWCKLDIDSGDSVPCGIIGTTQTLDDDPDSPQLPRDPGAKEGVQMFIWKSSLNELRVSRIYYARHYNDDGSSEIGLALRNYGDKLRVTSLTDTDSIPRFRYCRRELVVPLSPGWKAEEWHHVVVSWADAPDTNARLGIDCWIDGEIKTLDDGDSDPPPPLYNIDASAHVARSQSPTPQWPILMPHFVTGNIRTPKDSLYLGGFVRFQTKGDGIFKFCTSTFMPLNGTLDSVRIYSEPPLKFTSNSKYRLPLNNDIVIQFGRYSGDAQYTNAFLNLPVGRRLGCLYWNIHRPRSVREITWDVNPYNVAAVSSPTIKLKEHIGTSAPGLWVEPGNQDNPLVRCIDISSNTISSNQKLYYNLWFKGPGGDNLSTDYMTPAIFEDVTVTFEGSRLLEWEE